jgi:ABC-type amino acid transport substrate-binding protein
MGLKDKRRIIGDLNTISDALMRMAQFVADLAPYGVFAIVASSAGTLDVSELAKIQVYVVTYMAISMVATFLILPALVSTLTSLRYRDIISSSWGPLITAFATGNLLVVLPMLSYASKRLLANIRLEEDEASTAVDVLVPASFNFPNVGKLLSLSFVLFGGWFVGSSVPLTRYAEFLVTGFFTFFGSAVAGMPFLLNMFQLPTDLTELYVAVDVIATRFGTMVAAVNVLALALLGACAMCGRLRFRTGRLLRFGATSAAAVLVTLLGIRLFFTHVVQQSYEGYRVFIEMDLSTDPAPFEVYQTLPPGDPDPTLPTLERVRQRGSLRVGYLRDRLPFAFVNASGRLVGFDIEIAHLLAKQLGVSLELVRTELSQIPQSLSEGRCDIVMAGVVMTPEWSQRLSFSTPYMDTALGFVVRDHRKEEFSSLEALQNLESLRIGAQQDAPYYINMFRDHLPEAEIVLLRSPREFFREKAGELDALVYTAEAGSAWSLVYPDYSVAVPHPLVLAVPLAYPVKRGDRDMVDYVDVWIELKKKDGTIQRLHGPRWSVVRDLLHWVD